MTWGNRIRLLIGLIVTLAIVAACTVVFNQRQHRAQSTSATIVAQSYPVGSDYGGLITTQYVQVGDDVAAGDALFDVRSPQLQRDIAAGFVPGDPASDGTTTITSTVDGTVSSIDVPQGGFTQAGGVIATVDRSGSLFVEAQFLLSPRDYGRIERGGEAQLLLPNQSVLEGAIETIDVETVEGQAQSTVVITSDELSDAAATGLFQSGTPVSVSLQLRDDGPLAGVFDVLHDILWSLGP